MSTLTDFQDRFLSALLDPNAQHAASYGSGLSVYQNTVMKGLVDVLRANYPTVERLAGEEWFQAAALSYVRNHLPQQAPLALYGAEFSGFIRASSTLEGGPCLADVAHIDRCWTEAYFAADAPDLQAVQLADLPAETLSAMQLALHPATRICSVEHSAFTIWLNNRPPATPPDELEIADVPEYLLLTRVQNEVRATRLEQADHQFIEMLGRGTTLGEAALALLQGDAMLDLAAMLARAIGAGAFKAVVTRS